MQPNSVSWGSLRNQAEEAMKPLDAGVRVPVIVEKAEYKKAQTGSDMIVAVMAVFEGPHMSRKLFNNFVLTPDNAFAMTMFFENLAAFGLDATFFGKLEQTGEPLERQLQVLADSLVSRKAWLTMAAPREWQGKLRDNPGNFEVYAGQAPVNLVPGLSGGGTPGVASGASTPGVPGVPTGATPTVGATPGGPPAVPSF